MKRQGFYVLFFIPVFTACLESPEMTTGIVNGKEKPTVLTVSASPFGSDGNLLFQAEIISKGKAEITERGFYWSTVSNNPGINDNTDTVATGDNAFTYELKGASGEKTYYWRAFAKNSYGYDYGEVRSCQTPEIWVEKHYLNAFARGRGVVFALNNNIFTACGEYYGSGRVPVYDTWEYSIAVNSWDQIESFPGDNRIYPVVFTIGNYAFVGTGLKEATVAHKDFYRYDNTFNSWTEIVTPDDLEARYEAVAFSLNGKGYLVGGSSAGRESLNDVWQYDPENDSWEKKNDFREFYGGISICDNNRAFVGIGNASGIDRVLWEYDKETDSWSEFITLPDEFVKRVYSDISGVIIQNTIYIVDGDNTIWACDISNETKTWKKKADLPSDLLDEYGEGGNQKLLTTGNSNSIYVGLGFTRLLYEYRPLWDN